MQTERSFEGENTKIPKGMQVNNKWMELSISWTFKWMKEISTHTYQQTTEQFNYSDRILCCLSNWPILPKWYNQNYSFQIFVHISSFPEFCLLNQCGTLLSLKLSLKIIFMWITPIPLVCIFVEAYLKYKVYDNTKHASIPLNRIGFCYWSPIHSNPILWSKDLGCPFARNCEFQKQKYYIIQRFFQAYTTCG